MNLDASQRTLLSQFTIACCVCGGAYHFLVIPAKTALADTRAAVSKQLSTVGTQSPASQITPDQLRSIDRATMAKAMMMSERSRPAQSEATMFQTVSDIASATGVRLEQLTPQRESPRVRTVAPAPALAPSVPPRSPSSGPEAPVAAPKDTSVGYQFDVSGTYAQLTAFIASLSRDLGFTSITSVRFTLVGERDPDLLRAEIRTQHFAFDTAPVMASMKASQPASVPAPSPSVKGRN